jgi:hypothetical protein
MNSTKQTLSNLDTQTLRVMASTLELRISESSEFEDDYTAQLIAIKTELAKR